MQRSQAAFAFIFVTVLLTMLSIGMMAPVLPLLVEEMTGGDAAEAARYFGLMAMLWAVMQFLVAPVLGAMSDRFGRRPVVVFSGLGMAASYALTAWAPTLFWLFVARFVSGCSAASVSTAYAYIADTTPKERRAKTYGRLGAAFAVGFILGPAFGGLLGGIDARLPFWVAGALSLANALYGAFILPESLKREDRAPLRLSRANPLGGFAFLKAHVSVQGLAGVLAASQFAHYVLPSVVILHVAHRFNWDAPQAGLLLTVTGVASFIVQVGLIDPIVKRLGEARALVVGLVSGMTGFIVYAFAPSETAVFLGVPFLALWGLVQPSAQSLMTAQVDSSEQGGLQGAVGSLQGAVGVFAPLLFTQVYAYFVAPADASAFAGAPFLLAALILAGAATFSALRAAPVHARLRPMVGD